METRYLLDTNTIIYLRRRTPAGVRESFEKLQQGEAVVSVVTYGELMYGVAKSNQKQAAIATLQEIMRMLPLTPLPGAAGAIYGEIRAELEAKGKIIWKQRFVDCSACAGLRTSLGNKQRAGVSTGKRTEDSELGGVIEPRRALAC